MDPVKTGMVASDLTADLEFIGFVKLFIVVSFQFNRKFTGREYRQFPKILDRASPNVNF